jgi:hypothetical protein
MMNFQHYNSHDPRWSILRRSSQNGCEKSVRSPARNKSKEGFDCPLKSSGEFFWSNHDWWWLLVRVHISIRSHVRSEMRWSDSKRKVQNFGAHKVKMTIFFTSHHLITRDSLLLRQTYTQNYFINNIIFDIVHEKMRFCHKHRRA